MAEERTPKRLTRSSTKRVIGGVSGGLADYTALDPIIFRIAFIALAFAGGSGVLLYGLLWLAVPENAKRTSIAEDLLQRVRGSRVLTFAVVGGAILLGLSLLDDAADAGRAFLALALIIVGLLLLLREQSEGDALPGFRKVGEASDLADDATMEIPAAEAAPTRKRARRRSSLGLLTFGIAFMAEALALVLSSARVVHLDGSQYLALGLAVLGAGLIVGAWWGRSRSLIAGGVVVIPLLLVMSMVHVPLEGSLGSRHVEVGEKTSENTYQVLFGSLVLDFTRHNFGKDPTEASVGLVAGDLDVIVPAGVQVTMDGSVDLGVASVFGRDLEGRHLPLTGDYKVKGPSSGRLLLDLKTGFGSVTTDWARSGAVAAGPRGDDTKGKSG